MPPGFEGLKIMGAEKDEAGSEFQFFEVIGANVLANISGYKPIFRSSQRKLGLSYTPKYIYRVMLSSHLIFYFVKST